MIEHKVIGTPPAAMRFGLTGIDSIKQNIQVIASTYAGTVPLDRAFGISPEVVDQPYPLSQALLVNELIAAITEFEPRAEVISIDYEQGEEEAEQGILRPVIRFVEREVQ
ncbi:Gene 25-like lysozyme [Paenibacillus uliginis N3/975]|uniref:Gene 25-like lysozyme n=1 Tax=Paenibacillus uliginis N3/975 TaxID=1313296 RepID=A0A1X7HKU8_9BACL|nr:GPW/gp25 family protein [Paenibacillus uliginis]SMF88136.1 Gene 25-like lysozyme [Paenibacillus uliginis N3/975]